MKRHTDRDTPPRSKRSRSRYDRDDSRDRDSPNFDRRSRGRPGPESAPPFDDYEFDPRKFRSPEREGREHGHSHSSRRSDSKTPGYRSLCITNISNKINDVALKDTLIKELRKFGEFNVKVQYMGDQRVAYVNFRYPEDARAAKHARLKVILYDRQIVVDAVRNRKHARSPSPTYFPCREIPDMHPNPGMPIPHPPPFHYPPPPGLPPPMPFRPGPIHPPPPGPPIGRPHIMPPGRPPIPGLPPPRFENRDFMPPHPMPPREPPHFRHFEPPLPPLPMPPMNHEMGMDIKFPHHLSHVNPEDDLKATRTLFVGNLDYEINEMELKRIFDKFGQVEDIDIKRPIKGAGNAYAFIKYINLDYAHRAKVEMSGHYIGRFQCKIGYGKAMATTCLWVGGLGPWITLQTLEHEFDRFGVISKIDWPHGKAHAYILYDSIDAAQAAIQEMRGVPLGGPDRRLRIDFTDPVHINNVPNRNFTGPNQGPPWRPGGPPPAPPYDRRRDWVPNKGQPSRPSQPDGERRGKFDYRSRSPEDRQESRSFNDDKRSDEAKETELMDASNMSDLSKALPVAWNGALILKNNAFPARMHVVSGDVNVVDNLMRDPTSTETSVIRITQRLRLDDSKLDDVSRRITAVGPSGHCILLALPSSLENYESTSDTQQRPLKNLISYLNKKLAAGVVSLPPNPTDNKENVGILYAFPPCSFGYDLLHKKAPKVESDTKEDHLVVVAVHGSA